MTKFDIYGNKGCSLLFLKQNGILTPSFYIIKSIDIKNNNFDIDDIISKLEEETQKEFGKNLFFSVRSSSSVVMPGIMETVLNVKNKTELIDAIEIVKNSLYSEKAEFYKKIFKLPNYIPTAVIIQEMVYGNKDEKSGSGVYTTINPMSGDSEIPYGEYCNNICGYEIVGGTKTANQISNKINDTMTCLQNIDIHCFDKLIEIGEKIEKFQKYAQEIEFTIESGILYILQFRNAVLSPIALCKSILKMLKNNILTINEAKEFLKPEILRHYLYTDIKNPDNSKLIGNGLASSSGAAYGYAVFSSEKAVRIHEEFPNKPLILITNDTLPKDINGINVSNGLITKNGGSLCHASIVCRSLNIPAVTGCETIEIYDNYCIFGSNIINENDILTINGNNGHIYSGQFEIYTKNMNDEYLQKIINS